MPHTFQTLVEHRISANRFDPRFDLSDNEIRELLRIAVKAPTAYNLQNWRFVAVRSPAGKRRLRAAAFDQAKTEEASVVVIICGLRPVAACLPERLAPSVAAGFMSEALVASWRAAAASQYADPQTARDEAVRSATLAAAFLMLAAEAKGLVSCPMVGFEADRVSEEFGLKEGEVPVMLVAIGKAAPGNWPRKSRRPVDDVLVLR